ncbi:hypothetical protein MJC1_02849 [Methylocystis sp. MJC1]|nr:hypothetical protein MJC1_02849 [Methylocystis sp. MJC1]
MWRSRHNEGSRCVGETVTIEIATAHVACCDRIATSHTEETDTNVARGMTACVTDVQRAWTIVIETKKIEALPTFGANKPAAFMPEIRFRALIGATQVMEHRLLDQMRTAAGRAELPNDEPRR